MSQKRERQQVVRELVGTRTVGSQEELRQLLAERGWEVTQSTLSRDMHDLRVARVPTPGGVRYTTADTSAAAENRATLERDTVERAIQNRAVVTLDQLIFCRESWIRRVVRQLGRHLVTMTREPSVVSGAAVSEPE